MMAILTGILEPVWATGAAATAAGAVAAAAGFWGAAAEGEALRQLPAPLPMREKRREKWWVDGSVFRFYIRGGSPN